MKIIFPVGSSKKITVNSILAIFHLSIDSKILYPNNQFLCISGASLPGCNEFTSTMWIKLHLQPFSLFLSLIFFPTTLQPSKTSYSRTIAFSTRITTLWVCLNNLVFILPWIKYFITMISVWVSIALVRELNKILL